MGNKTLTEYLKSGVRGVILYRNCKGLAWQRMGEELSGWRGQWERKQGTRKAFCWSVSVGKREARAETGWWEGPGQGEA